MRRQAEREAIIHPVFPESMNFEYLLKNKFEKWVNTFLKIKLKFILNYFSSDEHLSKYWKLDTTFWWMKNLKFTHKKLLFFSISVTSQQSLAEADESTMPILFAKTILILGINFRYGFKFPKRWHIMMKEFKRAINGVSNFSSMCGSSSDLLPFLDWYHEKVKKVFETVENFRNIVYKYQGYIGKDKKR